LNGRKANSIIRLFDYSTISRSGFTLVEMLIVVAILATLMTIVFRLGSVGGEDSRRTTTVVRLQKIENCLSGYYAAFGSYPPVKVMGSRDIYCKVDENGDQDVGGGSETLDWGQINAACKTQPFGCEYPGDKQDNEVIEAWTGEIAERVGNSQDYPNYAPGKYKHAVIFQGGGEISGPNVGEGFNDAFGEDGSSDWKRVKLFKFGVVSFLLPRYLFMMGGDERLFGKQNEEGKSSNVCVQWSDNNDMPCDPFEGKGFDESENGWATVRNYAQTGNQGTINHNQLARIANIPSQAVCARWMPNLEHTCRTLRTMTFFGVQINHPDHTGLGLDDEYPPDPGTHDKCGGQSVKTYKNAFVTILDGWDQEYYYYSPAPYQSYTLWSAGRNRCTFPPWMDRTKFSNEKVAGAYDPDDRHIMTVSECVEDDIMQMSH